MIDNRMIDNRMQHSCVAFALVFLALQNTLCAQQNDGSPEGMAISFANQHHPELASLLGHLREMDQKRYDSAITDLYQTQQRLSKLAARDNDRYQSELKLWKLDSRVRLLAARSVSGMEDPVRAEIRALLIERNAIRLAQMKVDRDKVIARMAKMDDAIADLESNAEELAERDLERLVKSVKSRTTQNKETAKSKAKPPKITK